MVASAGSNYEMPPPLAGRVGVRLQKVLPL